MKNKMFKKLQKGKHPRIQITQPHEVIQRSHHELLLEVQYKYPGLYNLSRKTGHKLLNEIAKIIFDRVKSIMHAHVDTRSNCFKLTSHYRKMHPHFGDFQMILSTLHSLQDSSGAPRLEIQETELEQQPVKFFMANDISIESLRKAYKNYSDRVLKVMTAHIKSLDSKIADGDTEEVVAKKTVREQLKIMLPYMPPIVKQVVRKHFTPQNIPMYRIRIYGEPYLPSKDAMTPFVRRYHSGASRILRHPWMYNMLMFKIPQEQYPDLMAMDGTVVTGAKLVIRSDIPTYAATSELRSEMAAALGGPGCEAAPSMIDDIEDDLDEDEDVEMY